MDATAGVIVDHIDGDGLNNCRSNLRVATAAGNARNRRKSQRSPGYKGVMYDPKGKRHWRAYIRCDGKKRHLGSFATAQEAAMAYNRAAITLFGEFARLNEVGV